jgi:hypothetical protein
VVKVSREHGVRQTIIEEFNNADSE